MTLFEEAQAELATNPNAKLFISASACQRCGGHERYIKGLDCSCCKRNRNAKREFNAALTQAEKAKQRLDQAVALYQSTDLAMGEAAAQARVSPYRLSNELNRLGIAIRNRRPRDMSKPLIDTRAIEFTEAKTAIKAMRLLDGCYRRVHG